MDSSQEPKRKPSTMNQSIVPVQEQKRGEKQSRLFPADPFLRDGSYPGNLKIGGNSAEVLDLENIKRARPNLS